MEVSSSTEIVSTASPLQLISECAESALMEASTDHPSGESTRTSFRFQAKRAYLTFSQCQTTKESALLSVLTLEHVQWAVVGHELHADGGSHLHILIVFKKKLRTRDVSFFDFIGGKHPFIRSIVGPLWKCLRYIIKDNDYLCHPVGMDVAGMIHDGQRKRSRIASHIAHALVEAPEMTMEGLREQADAGWIMMNFRKIREWQVVCLREKRKRTRQPWVPISMPAQSVLQVTMLGSRLDDSLQKIVGWLNMNLNVVRPCRMKQLYIYGPTGVGKSTLIHLLGDLISVYRIPVDDNWHDHYEDGAYDIAVLDEFKRQKTRAFMLEWLAGFPMWLRRKGEPGYLKNQNIPTIVCSNFSVAEVYSDPKYAGTVEPFLDRVLEVYVPANVQIGTIFDSGDVVMPMATQE